jgi:single-strand DNA-binding protein
MGKDLNKVQLIGHVGKDPEGRYTPQGSLIVQFTVATGRTYKDSAGNQREETEWTKIACWGKLAELAQEYLRKGSRVYIEGRLLTRSWDDAQTGQKQYWTEVVANDIIFLDRRQDGPEVDGADEMPTAPAARLAPAAQPAQHPRLAPGVTLRARLATVTPPQDDDADELPF